MKVVLGILFPPSILLLDFKTSIASNDASHQADDTDADAGSSASDGGDGTHAEQQQRKRSLRTLFGAARNGSGKRLLRPETDVVDGEEDADADEGVRCECVLQKRPKTQVGYICCRVNFSTFYKLIFGSILEMAIFCII